MISSSAPFSSATLRPFTSVPASQVTARSSSRGWISQALRLPSWMPPRLPRAMTSKPSAAADGFEVIALGSLGGIQDGNLSAWLIHPRDDDRAVTCDAGTLVNGLRVADEKGALDDIMPPPDTADSRAGY